MAIRNSFNEGTYLQQYTFTWPSAKCIVNTNYINGVNAFIQ